MTSTRSPLPPPQPHTRRAALRALAGGVTLAGLGCLASRARAAELATRRIVFHNTHTPESLAVQYWRDGAYSVDALARVSRVLRDHRNGAVHPIDPALLEVLHDVAARCDRDAEFEVISGYRSPASNAAMHARSAGVAAHSLHMEGRAIDVRLVGCELAKLRDCGLALGRGGVCFYREPGFVHLDTGRVRTWVG
jgi:uncharacterized protein YcbK (DUF882 family)